MARKVPLRKFKVMLHGRNLLLKMEKVEKHDDQPIFEAEEVSEVESFRPGEKPIGLIFYPGAGDHDDA